MKSLESISDKELLSRLNKLVKKEHELTLEILLYIIQVENRRIYRSLGYSSMFVYCTDGLGYSESSANRRICAARAIRKCPEAYDYLRDGRVNLSNLAIAWKYVTPGLLDEIAGKTQRQVFAIVAGFEPKIKYLDSTRPVMVRQPVETPGEPQPAVSETEKAKLGENHLRCGGKKSSKNEISTPPETTAVKMETVKMHQVSCLVDDKVMQMLDRCKELLSGKYPCGMDLNTLLKELATTWLEKNDPVERSKRRGKRKRPHKPRGTDGGEISRHISPAVRDAVYKRDGGRCTYVGSNGKRCKSKWDLEIHHDQVPFSLGGGHSISNLRLLCAVHNRLEAEHLQRYDERGAAKRHERVYGKTHMEKFNRKIAGDQPGNDSDNHQSVRESNVFYVPSGSLTPYRRVANLVLSDARGAYGFS